MVSATINVALGIEPNLIPTESKKGVCIRYFTPKSGKLLKIEGEGLFNDIHVYDAEIYHQVGDIIPKVRSSLDRSGHVIVIGSTPQEAICKADKIIEEVKFITV